MKKIFLFSALCVLTACVYAGEIDVLKSRRNYFADKQTESINYYVDDEEDTEFLAGVEEVTYEEINRGVASTARTGTLMLSSKTDAFKTIQTEALQANKNVVMSSSYSPIYIRKDEFLTPFGEVELEGDTYLLAKQGDKGDVLIISGDGRLYNRVGRIVNGRLAVLDIYFFVEPNDVRILPAVQTSTETMERINGYELYYTGIDDEEMTFSYVSIGDDADVEQFSFPLNQQQIDINGLKIDVLDVNYNKITYIVN